MKPCATIVACVILVSTGSHAQNCLSPAADRAYSPVVVQSGTGAMAIAELYTSEGCESCPPADKWFSSLSNRKGSAIPLAFHVDYWDAGGWKDRFAKPAFTLRQRENVVRQGSRIVVTPQLIVNGKTINVGAGDDRRGSIYSRFNSRVSEIAAQSPRASLTIKSTLKTGHLEAMLAVTLPSSADRQDAAAFFALAENNLVSRITAGENGGATLYHDHVVRALIGPRPLDDDNLRDGQFVFNDNIVIGSDWKPGDLSLVGFVQNKKTGEVYQALSSPVCP